MKPSIRCLLLVFALAIGLPSAHAAEELILSLEDDSGARPKKRPSIDVVELRVRPASPPRAPPPAPTESGIGAARTAPAATAGTAPLAAEAGGAPYRGGD